MNALPISPFSQFSHPGVAASEELFACVAEAFANVAVAEAIRGQLPVGFDDFQGGLAVTLQSWTECEKTLGQVWRPSVAKLGRYVLEHDVEGQSERLGRVCLDLAQHLQDFSISFATTSGLPLCVCGYLFSPCDRVVANKRGTKLELNFISATTQRAELDLAQSTVVLFGSVAPLRLVHAEQIQILQAERTAKEVCEKSKYWLPIPWESAGTFGRQEVIQRALALLADVAPNYQKWVTRALHMVVVLPHLENRSCSGSWADASGMIYLTQPTSALEAAEILVHESSHQYFHMLEHVGPICKPGMQEMYYSPPVQKDRPLDRILIAYHAFANVLIMYIKAFVKGHGDQYTINRFHAFENDVAILEGYLTGSAGLSDLGQIVFVPLRTALAEARLASRYELVDRFESARSP